ncbi:uncharacterized protein LY79DRAFT_165920 [Colletotrichum navitas]|uniref:Uncharacterized protein n=1 Tax=Colletotrichum navitas TaxID=681940 RepID=A0AAD8Q1A8_9PEZI|nr:uncharacterized protein LY79DRAFT_165920 [Colletotrichum navitas]KAK1593986.1 hypothetical protein LY79DRAFT_165920 [Colletotrichum navitas]
MYHRLRTIESSTWSKHWRPWPSPWFTRVKTRGGSCVTSAKCRPSSPSTLVIGIVCLCICVLRLMRTATDQPAAQLSSACRTFTVVRRPAYPFHRPQSTRPTLMLCVATAYLHNAALQLPVPSVHTAQQWRVSVESICLRNSVTLAMWQAKMKNPHTSERGREPHGLS